MDQAPSKKLYRSRTDKIIAGVCGGLGEYFQMDPLIFRIIFLALLFAGGSGLWLYIVLAIIIPPAPLPGQANPGTDPRDTLNNFAAEVRQGAQQWVNEVKGKGREDLHHRRSLSLWFGLLIVAIGVLAFINRLFPQYWIRWDLLWPVALIVFGLMVLSRGGYKR